MIRYEYVIDWWDLNTNDFADIQRLINQSCKYGAKVISTTVDKDNNFIVTFQREVI